MQTSMMETSMTVNLLAVVVLATAVLIVLTLLNAGIGAPPEAPALGALGVGLVALGVALKGPELWSMLAAPWSTSWRTWCCRTWSPMCSQAGPRRVVSEVPAGRTPGTASGGPPDQLLPLVNRVLRPAEVTELRRQVAALPADCDTGLDPSTAYDVLSQLAELQARRRHGPNRVHCPYCGEGFDIAHGVTTRPPGWRNPPPRHPDPVAASSTLAGSEEATRVLATAMAWGSDRLRGKDAFWVDFGRIVVCPLLHLANITGRDMEELRLWTHPMRVAETMATVATELDALAPGADADRARRQWATIAGQREQAQRVAFSYAYGMIRHWELSPAAPSAEAPESGGPAGP